MYKLMGNYIMTKVDFTIFFNDFKKWYLNFSGNSIYLKLSVL